MLKYITTELFFFKKLYNIVAIILLLIVPSSEIYSYVSGSAVTQQVYGGRFGDQLSLYAKAKWFSIKYKILFLCRAFVNSENLILSEIEQSFSLNDEKKFKKVINLENIDFTHFQPEENVLYVMGFYTKLPSPWVKEVISELKKNVQLYSNVILDKPMFPKNAVSVAVHVRRGGGFDKPFLYNNDSSFWKANLLRFPPDSYYIDQIKKIADLYDNKPLYVYIFTDDKNPELIKNRYAERVNRSNIIWGCRKQNDDFNEHTLADFFSMQQFDCLIRAGSSFSIWVQQFGDFKIVIAPAHGILNNNFYIIDAVSISDKRQRKID